jgi:hypothetical protein
LNDSIELYTCGGNGTARKLIASLGKESPFSARLRKIALFKTCTTIILGNGEKTEFWQDRWLNRVVPKDVAPLLFRLAWWKCMSVTLAIRERKWTRGLQRISTAAECR